MTVNDISIPELSIADASRTIGGEDAEFKITSNIPFVGNLNVTYQPVETGTSFLDESDGPNGEDWSSSEDRTVPLNFALDGTEYVATLAVDTINDDNSPAGGTINITLQDDSADPVTYTVSTATGASSAQVSMIRAVLVPTLTIADTEGVETGGRISLKVTSNATSASTITVRYQASQERGDYLDETTSPSQAAEQTQNLVFSRSDSDDPFTANLVVDIHNDSADEDIGAIRVTLKADNEDPATYLVASDGSQNAIATIWDDDGDPTIIIGNAETVTEGFDTHIKFPLTSLVPSNSYLTLVWELSESGGDYFKFGGEQNNGKFRTINFGGKETIELSIHLDNGNDTNVERDSTVTLTLTPRPHSRWRIDPRRRVGTGTVTDDDSLPFVNGISSETTAISESAGSINFMVTADRAMTQTVYYQASEVSGGNFLTTEQEKIKSQSLTFAQVGGEGPFVDTLNVEFDNDEVGEVTGQIKVTLLAKPSGARNYRIRTGATTEVMTTIWDNDAPEISIGDATAPQITEAADAEIRFPLTALVSPNDSIDIYYTLTESTEVGDGDFIDVNEESSDATNPKSKSVDFSESKTTTDLVIPIASDDLAEGSSTITLTLVADPSGLADAKYNLATTVSAKTVTIEDDDGTPVLRTADILVPVNEDVDESSTTDANEVMFVVTAPRAVAVTVRYQASEVGSGNFLETSEESEKSKPMTFAQVDGTGPFVDTISVPIHDDSIGEATGQVKLTPISRVWWNSNISG